MEAEQYELKALEEHFAKVDANQALSLKENDLLSDFTQRVQKAQSILDRAAMKIQAIFRGVHQRSIIKQQLLSKKKKKKKGGDKSKSSSKKTAAGNKKAK
eukprot:CAMPEP_0197319482 /NCGR_PEP_ID=MMETSP0891-20130614/55068_1 /TAXON_ID=44058 ORGANISM="Aureoumbra lagunensis, Strain CCMP1510" /NCGR_SAMPLE_ID=MMETSP0891 /ASSEMBLY_ACC=CAM_ASM_000534 /LENGTH=99 /DNA_ID=CAMNT_0042810431 /DNA_START=104 /DNA_END=403 /DNA_ORIENTATION=-